MENKIVFAPIPVLQSNRAKANGSIYPQGLLENIIREEHDRLSKERKEKSIKILKDIENIPANWEDNIEDDYWDELAEDENTIILDSYPKEEE
jgi:hypothetical protein